MEVLAGLEPNEAGRENPPQAAPSSWLAAGVLGFPWLVDPSPHLCCLHVAFSLRACVSVSKFLRL